MTQRQMQPQHNRRPVPPLSSLTPPRTPERQPVSSATRIQRLQRTVGNQAVQRLLGAGGLRATPVTGRSGQRYRVIQREETAQPERQISSKAMKRITQAEEAIKHTKSVFKYGAGNQAEALEAHNFNTYYRLMVQRDEDNKYWKMTDEVKPIADANPVALSAAKADITAGGNCGEHADVAFDYLRVNAPGEWINHSSKAGLDHAFVILGEPFGEAADELVVADPWPTRATATTWDDHFAYTSDLSELEIYRVAQGDGKNVKGVIAAGLTLTDEGKKMLTKKDSDAETKQQLKEQAESDEPWVWNHPDAAAEGRKHTYVSAEEPGKPDKPEVEDGPFKSDRFKGDSRLEQAYFNAPVMRRGEKGDAVAKIQQALVDDGYQMPNSTTEDGEMDGIYGWETYKIVYKFQVKHQLKFKDGAVGNETLTTLDGLYS